MILKQLSQLLCLYIKDKKTRKSKITFNFENVVHVLHLLKVTKFAI